MNRTRRTAPILLAALALGAAAAAQQHESAWQYRASNDGFGHWLYLSALEAEVATPYGVLTTDAWPGQRPPTLMASCREADGEPPLNRVALALQLVMSAHPEEPIASTLSLRSAWWALTRTTPGPRIYPTTVRLGSSRFESTFELPPVRYLEPDAVIPLDVEAATRELLSAPEPAALVLEATGRTEVEASFRPAKGYLERLHQMIEACP